METELTFCDKVKFVNSFVTLFTPLETCITFVKAAILLAEITISNNFR